MSHSVNQIIVHIVFSTKKRYPFIHKDIRSRLHAYQSVIVRSQKCQAYRVGGIADHVHLAVGLGLTISIAELINKIKSNSARWIKAVDPSLSDFAWQQGYACFSITPTKLDLVKRYIERQEEHHRNLDFKHEYIRLLRVHRLKINEAMLWD